MNQILSIPIELRLVALFVIGAAIGGQLNRAIYALAWTRRVGFGPWSPPAKKAPPRRWFDKLPILGWLTLRRETKLHGRSFWVRPLLIEFGAAIGFAWLYRWEIHGGLLPELLRYAPETAPPALLAMLHVQFVLHVVLISLMVVATFIDFDEQIIPDSITVPGTLAALVIAVVWPSSRLPIEITSAAGKLLSHLQASSPGAWPDWFDAGGGLACGLACFVAWCVALMPKTWTTRYGLLKGVRYLLASVVRPRRRTNQAAPRGPFLETILLLGTAVVGSAGIALVWSFGGARWPSLLSALFGLAFGGAMIWSVRIIGSVALGKEAMGFGDVTLMAMIGAFLGWQPALMIFFLAPFAALLIAASQWLLMRRNDIAFGPYLCLATLILLLAWDRTWNGWADTKIFALGSFIPILAGCCLIMLGVMLTCWRYVKERIFGLE